MARPRKPLSADGVVLPKNLYRDPKGREGYWRYKRPDGKFKTIRLPINEAIALAEECNKAGTIAQETRIPQRDSIEFLVENFIAYRENIDPKLSSKQSWKNRKGYLRQFGTKFAHTSSRNLKLLPIQTWWDSLTGNAQRSRKPEFNKLFNFMASQEATPKLTGNPFTAVDDKPRVLLRPTGDKSRQRLTIEQFWEIHKAAGEQDHFFLQIAMEISLYTTLRRGDIAHLKFDTNIEDGYLCKTVSKAKESGRVVNLRWKLSEHPLLAKSIRRARSLSLVHFRCPYVLSREPQKRTKSEVKTHYNQVLPHFLTQTFREVRESTGLFEDLDSCEQPSFHEIRSLSSHLFDELGYESDEVQVVMAHTDKEMTEYYQGGHKTKWTDIHLVMSDKVTKKAG